MAWLRINFYFTLSHSASFEDFHTKTTESHLALHERNFGTGSGRELFKGSKDSESLLHQPKMAPKLLSLTKNLQPPTKNIF